MLLFKIFITLFCFLSFLHAEEVGSLLVTYQTGTKGERLGRIRFRLENTLLEQQLHPKKGVYLDDSKLFTRTVAIEKLPVGMYTIQFLIPNKDGYFEEVPCKEILISENKTLKINQQIKHRIRQIN